MMEKFSTEDVLKAHDLIAVLFTAEWCEPCTPVEAAIEAISEHLPQYHFVHCNVDENPVFTAAQNIRAVPTVAIFKKGRQDAFKVGDASVEQWHKWLEENAEN